MKRNIINMKRNILLSLLILFTFQVMAQEKGSHLTIYGGFGPTGITYKLENVNFADPTKCEIKLGGQAGLGYSYFFTKNVGLSLGIGVAHYRTQGKLMGEFNKDNYLSLGTYTDNDNPLFDRPVDFDLRVRTQNWAEYQSVRMMEIPLLLNLQKKFGEREGFGLFLNIGAKFQLPLAFLGETYSIMDGNNKNDPRLNVSGYYGDINSSNLELGRFDDPDLYQHGFGKIHNPSEVLTNGKGDLDLKFNVSLVGEAGILISLSRRVDLSLGAFIDYGLLDMRKEKEGKKLFIGPEPESNYHPDADKNIGKGITYNSLVNSEYVNKVSSISYGGKVGVRIKLGKLKEKQQPQASFVPCDKDTVYIYKFESVPVDSLLQKVLDALDAMPRNDTPVIYQTIIYGDTTPRKYRFDDDDDFDENFPDYIKQKDIDILFLPIYFDLDKAILRPESIEDLDKKVEILKRYPEIKLIIFGNTCDLGNDPHNFKLGERRAQAAKDYLISKGIDAERLDFSTLSRFQPEKPNTSEPNRQHNRRDDFKPIYPKKMK